MRPEVNTRVVISRGAKPHSGRLISIASVAGLTLFAIMVVAGASGASSSYETLLGRGTDSLQGTASCRLKPSVSKRLTLRNGEIVSIDPSGFDVRRGEIMIVGSPLNRFRREEAHQTLVVGADSTIGVLRDAGGRWRDVSSPFPGRAVVYPRVASAGASGWYVLFMTTEADWTHNRIPWDTATIWLGLYDGFRWKRIERVASTQHAALDRRSSRLVAEGDRLYFAYRFGETTNDKAARGVIVLWRRDARWRQDTLRTWDLPANVQITARGKGAIGIAITQDYFENHIVGPQAVFLSWFDSSLHPIVRTAQRPGWSALSPSIEANVDGRVAVVWQSERHAGDGRQKVHDEVRWLIADSDARAISGGALTRNASPGEPGVAALKPGRTLVVVREDDTRNNDRAFLIDHRTARDLGPIRVSSVSLAQTAVPESDSTALLLSGELGAKPADPPGWTNVTELTVVCPAGRRD